MPSFETDSTTSSRWNLFTVTAITAVLTAFFYTTNPYFFGDATWYAMDIARVGPLISDPGHLAWRPVARAASTALDILGVRMDPLDTLRLESAIATAVLCVASYTLAFRLTRSPWQSLAVATIVGGSNACLTYGGSGSAYTPAMALVTLAALFLVNAPTVSDGARPEWTLFGGALAAIAFIASVLCWGVSLLMLPTIGAMAFFESHGAVFRRAARSLVLTVSIVLGFTATLVLAYALDPSLHTRGFVAWLRSSSHDIPMTLSAMGLSRAALGFVISFLNLGDLGRSLKGLLLGDEHIQRFQDLSVPICAALMFTLMLLAAAAGLITQIWRGSRTHARVALYACTAVAAVAAFAAVWQGSDVERFCLSLPMLSIAVVSGLAVYSVWGRLLVFLLAGLVVGGNLGTLTVPALGNGGGFSMALGRIARQHIGEGGLLVVTGQEIGGRVSANAAYFDRIEVFNISMHVSVNGDDAWASALQDRIDEARKANHKIAVLSDLVGRPTLGGIGLSLREFPKPTFTETAAFFADWRIEQEWQVDRFRFLTLQPPIR